MPPSHHPLDKLVQSIHLSHPSPQGSDRFILTTFSADSSKAQIKLYGSGKDGQVEVWTGTLKDAELEDRLGNVAEAIKGGFIHLDFFDPSEVSDSKIDPTHGHNIEVQFLPPGKRSITIKVEKDNDPSYIDLFDATIELLSRPAGGGSSSEMRALRAELSQKEAEITHLGSRLQSAKANAARLGPQDKKKLPISPQKKAPANASALQPNQKRRRAVEDEFAGSSDEEDD